MKFFWRDGSWRRPGEWVFHVEETCVKHCIRFDIGWFGFVVRRNGCREKE